MNVNLISKGKDIDFLCSMTGYAATHKRRKFRWLIKPTFTLRDRFGNRFLTKNRVRDRFGNRFLANPTLRVASSLSSTLPSFYNGH